MWQKDVLSALRAFALSELGITAADADGNALEVTATLLDASGEVVTDISECGGETLTVEVTSSQSDEGRTFEATIEIKVYGMPTIAYQHEYWYYQEGEEVTAMFSAVDSFNQPLEVTVNVEEQTEDGVYVLVTATDIAGNTSSSEKYLRAIPANSSWLHLYVGEEYIDNIIVKCGEDFTLYSVPGYSYEWSLDGVKLTDEKGNSLAPWDKASGAYTLTADADLITYAVTYDLDGGVNSASNPSSYTIASEMIILRDASRVGYDFVGWYDGEQEVIEIASGSMGDKTLTARWELITYTIVYDGLMDGTHYNASEYTIESDTIVLQDASRVGYDFVGWYDGKQKVSEIESGSHGDKTLTAKWQIQEYSVDYSLDGGINEESNPLGYTVETLGGADGSIALADPSKKGEILGYTSNGGGSFEVTQNVYTFLGWYKDPSFEQKVTALTLDLGDVTLYAKWSEPTAQTETVQVYTREGDYIYFGEYPQTIKSSDVTVGDVADEDGYYLGSDGERYAKVVADPYQIVYTFSNGSAVKRGNTYYFKVEPIRWRILREDDGSAFILADGIIANRQYDPSYNDYADSEIRAWLNGEFLNSAFGEVAQSLIETTEVDNSVYSTGYDSNRYACENTFDKVFLLSYREVVNSDYGFASSTARQMTVNDYARSTGAYYMYPSSSYFGCGYWWLRSPGSNYSNYARCVSDSGRADDRNVSIDRYGVVPALNITL